MREWGNENGEMRMEHGDVIQACKSTSGCYVFAFFKAVELKCSINADVISMR